MIARWHDGQRIKEQNKVDKDDANTDWHIDQAKWHNRNAMLLTEAALRLESRRGDEDVPHPHTHA